MREAENFLILTGDFQNSSFGTLEFQLAIIERGGEFQDSEFPLVICESGGEYQDSRHGIPEFSLVIFESGGEFHDCGQ